MSLAQAVSAARAVFPNVPVATPAGTLPLPVVMVAIAGAESGWDPTALGDYGDGGPTCPIYGSATSFGLWQIHNVHAATIAARAGTSDPCQWIPWLFNPLNNAALAYSVYSTQGFGAWTTYTTGAWLGYLPAALAAMGGSGSAGHPSASTHTPPPASRFPAPATAGAVPEWALWAFLALAVFIWGDVTMTAVEHV